MNWKRLSEQYPKAWRKFMSWCNSTFYATELYDLGIGGGQSFGLRNLYDLFDQEGIFCTVGYNEDTLLWGYWISGDDGVNVDPRLASRAEAEQTAFTKAFSILEERLSNA